MAPRELRFGPRSFKIAPRGSKWPSDGFMGCQGGSKMAPAESKMAPGWPQEVPTGDQMDQDGSSNGFPFSNLKIFRNVHFSLVFPIKNDSEEDRKEPLSMKLVARQC